MRTHLAAIAAIVTIAGQASADPKDGVRAAQPQPQHRAVEVVLASAEPMHASPDGAQSSAPQKRRVGRVTTCRCGDPQADPETQDQ